MCIFVVRLFTPPLTAGHLHEAVRQADELGVGVQVLGGGHGDKLDGAVVAQLGWWCFRCDRMGSVRFPCWEGSVWVVLVLVWVWGVEGMGTGA
jgi:hypothetical protein